MPQWDRYWPLGLAGSLALLAASVALSVWYLASLFALPQQFGLPPLTHLGQMGGGVIWTGSIGGLLLLSSSRDTRRRIRLRRLALAGDLSVMPLAIAEADPANTPDAAHLPVVIPWRRKPRGREWVAPAVLMLVFGSGPGILLALAMLGGAGWRQTLGDYASGHSIGDFLGMVLVMACATSLAVTSLVAVIRALTSQLGPEYGVVADDEGISTLHLEGQGPRMRWGDVRLLEVSLFSGSSDEWIFMAYGPRASVYWQDVKKARKRRRLEISHEEFAGRQRALLALIASRTGLQPRTLATPLMRDDNAAQRPTRNYRGLAYGIGYGLAGGLVLLAIAVLALPLTHNPLLDGYAATMTALAGIALIVITRQALKPARASSSQLGLPYVLPVAPPLTAEPLEVAYHRRLTGRLRDAAIGLVLALNVVPAVAAQFFIHDHPSHVPLLDFPTRVVADLLSLIGLIGLVVITVAIGTGPTILTASPDGLREREGRTATHLPWGTVVSLSLELDKGTPDQFTALSRDGDTIRWPARDVVWRGGRWGQQWITAEELAAIVVQRSGVPLTIKEA
jgi:hypothetical protein